ncbi:MAG: hypothetical protein J5I47_11555 [Vicingus serpentipes]|nr:hypothetical protein [Vicingus serpentipes]
MKKTLLIVFILFLGMNNYFAQTAIDLAGTGNKVTSTYNLDVTNGFTLEYKMYMPSLKNYNAGVTQGCSNVGNPLDVYINSAGTMIIYYGNCSAAGGTVAGFSAGQWYHSSYL